MEPNTENQQPFEPLDQPIPSFVKAKEEVGGHPPPIPITGADLARIGQILPWSHRLPLGLQLRHGMTAQGLLDRIQVLEKYGFVVVARHEPWYERVWRAFRLGGA